MHLLWVFIIGFKFFFEFFFLIVFLFIRNIPTASNTSCDDIGPVFLMYNNGLLNSFGIILAQGPMDKISDGWEQPPQNVFSFFFDPKYLSVPSCTYSRNITAMHFSFNSFYSLRC